MTFGVCQQVISTYYNAKCQIVARLCGQDRFFCHVQRKVGKIIPGRVYNSTPQTTGRQTGLAVFESAHQGLGKMNKTQH
ncbi:hypothetical protein Lmor_2971 [Legionella moravica]|uniref:Uncharacterized protein n=1 Tax=Legionella moravica TaxID=39962 RepID=A0A378K228_9GAMM|nr:hypothetical protein Lmor_2971 [Legionella moravica]STX63309.1 Uncharacterised protein [Legionella moravica]